MVNSYDKFFSNKPLVKCYSEFQPLEEVIVGSTYNPNCFDSSDQFSQEAKDLLKRVFTETAEDLEVLVDILKKEGVTVQRPKSLFDPLTTYNLGEFDIEFSNQPLQPRDILGFYGNHVKCCLGLIDCSRYCDSIVTRLLYVICSNNTFSNCFLFV